MTHSTNGNDHSNGTALPVAADRTAVELRELRRELRELRRLVVKLVRRQAAAKLVGMVRKATAQKSATPQLMTMSTPLTGDAGDNVHAAPTKITALHRKILAAVTSTPQTSRRIINATELKYNSYSRRALTALLRAGLVIRGMDGLYRLPPQQP